MMPKPPRTPATKPAGRTKRSVKLFISYAHENKVWMKRLTPLLDGLKWDDRMATQSLDYLHAWHDKELTAGSQWDGEIKRELDEMNVFVPLISAEFFSSHYIQEIELARAKERHALGEILVVPIRLYDIDLRKRCAFLHGFNSFPATDKCWSNYRDRRTALEPIYEGLWAAIDEALKRK